MSSKHFNFTEKAVDEWVRSTLQALESAALEFPKSGQFLVYDRGGPQSLPGFALRIRFRKASPDPRNWSYPGLSRALPRIAC